MKCPRCWSETAFLHPPGPGKDWLLRLLLIRRMKCRHCYHKFHVFWPFTWGKAVTPPVKKSSRSSVGGGSPASTTSSGRVSR
jgi:hypothetical protein